MSLYLKSSTAQSIEEAKGWTTKVSDSPSIWNVFLFGNISTIEKAIEQWTESLNSISKKCFSSETDVEPFSTANIHKENALNGLANLRSLYQETKVPNALAITTLIICYLMLLCPYFVQERHSRSVETFFGKGNNYKSISINKENKKQNTNRSKYDSF